MIFYVNARYALPALLIIIGAMYLFVGYNSPYLEDYNIYVGFGWFIVGYGNIAMIATYFMLKSEQCPPKKKK